MAKRDVIGRGWWIGWVACAASMACGAQSSVADPAAFPGTPDGMYTTAVRHAAVVAHKRHMVSLSHLPVIAEGQPGVISLQNGKLTIYANDSELAQILGSLSALTGMTVKGIASLGHVFGVYGPGPPSDVLTQLLSGSNYDFVMVGVIAEGLPRELLLNAHTQGIGTFADGKPLIPGVSSDGRQNAETGSVEGGSAAENRLVPQAETASTEPLGPGAIAHVPPNEVEGSGNFQDNAARVQQNLQRLRHIQEQQGAPQ